LVVGAVYVRSPVVDVSPLKVSTNVSAVLPAVQPETVESPRAAPDQSPSVPVALQLTASLYVTVIAEEPGAVEAADTIAGTVVTVTFAVPPTALVLSVAVTEQVPAAPPVVRTSVASPLASVDALADANVHVVPVVAAAAKDTVSPLTGPVELVTVAVMVDVFPEATLVGPAAAAMPFTPS
jgi:hypothetical protein